MSRRLSLQVNGSEDYKIPVQGLAIDFLKRDGQITVEGRNPSSWDITRHLEFPLSRVERFVVQRKIVD